MTYHTTKQTTTGRTLVLDDGSVPFGVEWQFKQHHEVLRANDIITVGGRRYQMGSTVSYALERNDCPIHSFNRSVERDEATHWVNAMCSVISNPPTIPEPPVAELQYGDWIWFEGYAWELVRTPNQNVGLRQVDVLSWYATLEPNDA